MTKYVLAALAIALPAATIPVANGAADIHKDVQLRAMSDELARAKTLELNNLDKPYFIEYTVGDSDQANIMASLGGITSSTRLRVRSPRLTVRVGDYKFDNTNSIYSGSPRFGALPIDDDYLALRGEFWLTTDGLYKSSADQITRKRNALREIADPDKTPDLAPAKPAQILQKPAKLSIDQKHWEDALRRASGRFAAYPAVMQSSIRLRAISSTYRLANTEGTLIRVPQELSEVAIRAVAFAPDGSRVWNHWFFTAAHPSQLPGSESLDKVAQAVAAETEALAKAPAAEDYTDRYSSSSRRQRR
jgi:hypothetical protein